jgi:endoglucanase
MLTIRALLICLFAATQAQAESAADRFNPRRGLNFDLWVEWLSVEDMVTRPGALDVFPDWRRHVPDGAVAGLATDGFDVIRLPIDPAPFLRLGPGPAQDALIGQVVETTAMIQTTGLKVIVDLHAIPRAGEPWGTDSIVTDPASFDAYAALVATVAARLHGMDPDRTALELLNEPTLDCGLVFEPDLQKWPGLLSRLHHAARTTAPDLPLVVSGGCWGSADGLLAIDPATLADDNLIWSFHSYAPYFFTHQGAGWSGGPEAQFAGVAYPPSTIDDAMAARLVASAVTRAAGQGDLTQDMLATTLQAYRDLPSDVATEDIARVADWADTHAIPRNRILLGEFGAIRDNGHGVAVPPASRGAFLDAKISAVEAAGFGWAVYDWTGSLAVADPRTYRMDPALCPALRLTGC